MAGESGHYERLGELCLNNTSHQGTNSINSEKLHQLSKLESLSYRSLVSAQ